MIQHTIELTKAGYRLVIWEPATKTTSRINPFIFRATYLISSPSKAVEILKMVEGEPKTIFSGKSYKSIDEQITRESYKVSSARLSVALEA